MDEKSPKIIFRPIGVVHNEVNGRPPIDFDWPSIVSTITIDSDLTEGLERLEDHSHIIVIFWLHRPHKARFTLKVRPYGDKSLPMAGVLASRSPHRPNAVGQKTVRLLKREDNVLWVEGLDAYDGTPVIDIKPFIPGYDSPEGAKKPQWRNREKKQS